MLKPAVKYLTYRSIGAPAVLLSLAMQGIFRGFKDTTTPLYVIGIYIYIYHYLSSAVECLCTTIIVFSLTYF